MAEKIAEYFGALGFQVNDKGLKEFIKKLEDVADKMKGLTKASAGTSPLAKVAQGMQDIGAKAKVAADAVDKASEKIVKSNKKITQSQIKEQQKLDAALRRGNASNPLTEVQQKMRVITAKRSAAQAAGNTAEQARLDAWFAQAQRKEQALMKSSAAAYRRSSALGNSTVGRAVMGANKNVASRQAADAAELARYEAWFGKAESRDASLGIAGGKVYGRSRTAGNRTVAQVRADILAAKALRDSKSKAQGLQDERELVRQQRRKQRMDSEEERRFQNRISRTYSPLTSKLIRQQADYTKVQERYNTALAAGNKLEAERYKYAMKSLRSNIKDINRERIERRLGWFGKSMGYGRSKGGRGALALLQPSLGMVAAGGAAGAGYFMTDAFRQMMDIQSYNQQFQALYGSESSGKAGLRSYIDYSNKMGVGASKNVQEYLRFMFASKDTVGLDKGRKIYESFSVLAKTRGVKGDAYNRSLTALSQILSKGSMQSEEVDFSLL